MSESTPPPLPTRFHPLAENRRHSFIDVLRGFAIFGIFLVNMGGFKTPLFAEDDVAGIFGLQGLNEATRITIELLASGKFISIFALIFGMGMVMQENRSQVAGRPFAGFQRRRMAVMLCFGIAHGVLLWAGDVLAVYALFGMLGLLFLRAKAKTLIIWMAGLMVLVSLLGLLLGLAAMFSSGDPDESITKLSQWTTDSYLSGSFTRIISARTVEWALCWVLGLFSYIPYVFCMFLFGILLASKNILGRLDEWQPRLNKLLLALLPTGLILVGIHGYATHSETSAEWLMLPGMVCYFLSMPILSISYMLMIHRCLRAGRFPRLTHCLAAVGRLSLSHYLLQSVVANVLFMGWGFGLYGKIESWLGALIVIAVFAIQCAISPIWLKYFKLGPAEWLWRTLAYGERPRMRRSPSL